MATAALDPDLQCTAFLGRQRLASGRLADVVPAAHGASNPGAVLVLDDLTGQPVELHLTGSLTEAHARLAQDGALPAKPAAGAAPRRGRPKLGVVAREVTLLPRHWAWLGQQPGGASAAMRRLVEQARRSHAGADLQRSQQQVAYNAMQALMGDEPGFEAASRALFAADGPGFDQATGGFAPDLRAYARRLAAPVFAAPA